MKEIKEMTEEIKGKQAAYRLQEEDRRDCVFLLNGVTRSRDEDARPCVCDQHHRDIRVLPLLGDSDSCDSKMVQLQKAPSRLNM